MLFPCEESGGNIWELGNPVDFPHDTAYHNRPAPVAWSGTNYHK